MWAVWGKQNSWFEYVGFYGCPVMLVAAIVALKNLRLGSIFGCIGFGLMLFYLVPALINTILRMRYGNLVLETPQILQLVLLIVVPLLTLITLIWNLKSVSKSPHDVLTPRTTQ